VWAMLCCAVVLGVVRDTQGPAQWLFWEIHVPLEKVTTDQGNLQDVPKVSSPVTTRLRGEARLRAGVGGRVRETLRDSHEEV
jgi:hypothetical protein